ncbi:MAG: hypothetical protein K0R14_2223 [Burkholderiales bacterium]|jgi:hypothetical protein|nr:hypothetical protein [Burkholderiales bacterium]
MSNIQSNNDVIIVNGVKLKFSNQCQPKYNLSSLKRWPYQVEPNGYYITGKPVLDPLEWINSFEGKKHIHRIHPDTKNTIYMGNDLTMTIYTNSYYVWLGYLKHCIGDIDTAISAELAL